MNKRMFAGASIAGALGALALTAGIPSVANATAATSLNNCSVNDISPAAGQCAGLYAGNQLGQGGDMADTQAAALAALGYVGSIIQVEHLNLSTDQTEIDFDTLLNGVTFIGVHWGNGGGPFPGQFEGGVTGFYRLDLANDAQLDKIFSAYSTGNSGAVLFRTSQCEGPRCDQNPGGEVPEPATWAMMIIGFGGVGALIRRRRGLLTAA